MMRLRMLKARHGTLKLSKAYKTRWKLLGKVTKYLDIIYDRVLLRHKKKLDRLLIASVPTMLATNHMAQSKVYAVHIPPYRPEVIRPYLKRRKR